MVKSLEGRKRHSQKNDAALARDQFVNMGGTVNGMVLGNNAEMLNYYRTQVIGGPGAFVIPASDRDTIADAMTRKFVNDMIATTSLGSGQAIAGTNFSASPFMQ